MKTAYNCNRKKEEDCIVKVKSRQKQPPHVIASLPHGVSEEDVVFLAWMENFGTRYRANQYVLMDRIESGFEDDIVMGRIEALFKYNNNHYLVCEEMVIYDNEVLDGYDVYSHHEKKFRSIEINSLLDFYPLEGYTAGTTNTTVVVLRHYPYYHPQDRQDRS